MPVPTDTFWNIPRLNKIFALSALLMLATFAWSIWQDWDKDWRKPQQHGKVWEAALVDQRLVNYRDLDERVAALDKDIETARAEIEQQGGAYQSAVEERKQLESDLAILDFRTNTLKAVVAEQLKYLEEAKTAGDQEKVEALTAELAEPQKQVAEFVEKQGRLKMALAEKNEQIKQLTADLEKLRKQRTALTEERDSLKKKRDSLQPTGSMAKLSTLVRQAPLLQFVNPAEKPHQVVLPDVMTDLGGVKTVQTIDRCVTCHVNIDKRDFTEDKILAYLEEQVATARRLNLPQTATGKPNDPLATLAKPGPAAMAEFWLKWGAQLQPGLVTRPAMNFRTAALSSTVGKGKPATVEIDGKALPLFKYNADAKKPDEAAAAALTVEQRFAVVTRLIDAWLRFQPGQSADTVSSEGSVKVTIAAGTSESALAAPRRAALLIVEDFHKQLMADIDAKTRKSLLDRYRRAMVAEVNLARGKEGLPELDPSPVMLAHPNLELYVDVDSKHPIEKVGCTSCHDGSGLETRFILAAHTPRPIWVDSQTGEPVLPQQLKPAGHIGEHAFTLDNMLRTVFPEGAIVPSLKGLALPVADQDPTTRPAVAEAPAEPPPGLSEPVAYIDPVTGARGKAVSQRAYWKKRYEHEAGQTMETTEHYWDFPMRPPQFIQANCVRCHTSVHDIQETAPVVHKGRHLFTNLGCNNCHTMDGIPMTEQRKVGTDLRHVASKLSPEMINTWLWAPKAFRPTTKMPHFFMLENNSSDEELRRTRQEAAAMTEYLVQTSEPLPPKHTIPPGLAGKAEEGQKIFNTIGCLACHQNLNDPVGGQRNGKPITRGEQWIIQDLKLSGELAKQIAAKSDAPLSDSQLRARVEQEATKIFDAMTYNERQMYVQERFDQGSNVTSQLEYYPDGKTPKPVFMSHGPELSAIGQKLTAGRSKEQARAWLFDWLKEPRHYSDYTTMPSLRLSDQQALDLAEYLLAQSRKNSHPDDPWTPGLPETDSEKLRELTSLFLRSRYPERMAYERADDEKELRELAIDALTNAKTDKSHAARKVDVMDKDTMRKVYLGKKLINHYGCMQCHQINGMEMAASPCPSLTDWGIKLVSKLEYNFVDAHKAHSLPPQQVPMVNGLAPEASHLAGKMDPAAWSKPVATPVTAAWPHVGHTREEWLLHKLTNSRIWDRGRALLEPQRDAAGKLIDPGRPYDKIKMPTFYLNDDEVNALATFVLSSRFASTTPQRLVSESITKKATNEQARRIAHGRYLVTEKYNCTSCHLIETNRPQIQQYPVKESVLLDAPPQLRSEGSRINHAWLYNFLKNPTLIRPRLEHTIRMPTFPATDDEWTSIIAYFADLANRESRELKRHLDPILAYRNGARTQIAAANGSTTALEGAGADWYLKPSLAANVAYLRQWGLDHKYVVPSEVSPTAPEPDRGKGHEKLLYAARLVQEAYQAPYPFVQSNDVDISEERFKLGEALFLEADCLQCHAMGKVSPGVEQKGPNFWLMHNRIRRGWAYHWVKDPNIIHMDSAMLPQFSGMAIFDPRGQTFWRTKGATPEEIARTEAVYGKTPEEQINLILDFIYTASARRHQTDRYVVDKDHPPPSEVIAKEKNITFQVPGPATQPATAPAAETPPTPPAAPETPAPSPPPAEKVAMGTVTGTVTLNGDPPKRGEIDMSAVRECHDQHSDTPADETVVVSAKGELKNVIISLKREEGVELPVEVPAEPAVIDQKGCQYIPHVLPVMVGQPIVVKNTDNFEHNVHSFSKLNVPFNFAQRKDPGRRLDPMKSVEQFTIKCDVHPWMMMHVAVFDHPYFAVSGEDGKFKLPPLPAGQHKLRLWHEKFGEKEVDLTVEADKTVDIKVAFDQK